jgi:hypothetical protein
MCAIEYGRRRGGGGRGKDEGGREEERDEERKAKERKEKSGETTGKVMSRRMECGWYCTCVAPSISECI